MMLTIREVTRSTVTGWDEFAKATGASMEVSRGWLDGWRLRHLGRVRLFEVVAGDTKVGQCAVLGNGGNHDLRDGLMLDKQAHSLWPQAMAVLLSRLGPGQYRLGSKWSPASPADAALADVPGVTIASQKGFIVQAVDFSRWPDWESYWQGVSSNVRRNVAKGYRDSEHLVDLSHGRPALRRLPLVLRGNLAAHRRKSLGRLGWRVTAHMAGEGLACRDHLVVAALQSGQQPITCRASIAFGRRVHYLGGGGSSDAGAGWLVMHALLQQAHAQGPGAMFIMGPFDPERHDEAIGGGLLRSRRACRVSDLPARITRFSFAG